MRKHTLDDRIARLPWWFFSQGFVWGQRNGLCFFEVSHLSSYSFNFINKFAAYFWEVIDKISGFWISWAMACSSSPSEPFFGLDDWVWVDLRSPSVFSSHLIWLFVFGELLRFTGNSPMTETKAKPWWSITGACFEWIFCVSSFSLFRRFLPI